MRNSSELNMISIAFAGLLCLGVSASAAKAGQDSISWLDNGKIRLGIDLNLGGSITYLADAKTGENLINSHDWGRQVQLSFYSGPNPFAPEGKELHERWKGLGWNPIQSGDVYENRSQVIAHTNDGNSITVRCIPMIWPLNNSPGECIFECTFNLKDRTVLVSNRLINNRADKTLYHGRSQELPAVYTNGPYHRLMTYTGDQPFSGAPLEEIPKQQHPPEGIRWAHWTATENWAALVNEQDFGLGIWNKGVYHFIGGFAGGKPGTGGPKDAPTGYIAPLHKDILDWNIEYQFSYVLIVDTLTGIRDYVYAHASKCEPPQHVFSKDRQHWTYHQARDTGWPIQGYLEVHAAGKDPQCLGPESFWQAHPVHQAELIVSARKKSEPRTFTGRLYWKTKTENRFSNERSLSFEVTADETFRTYTLDIGKHPGYAGMITGLRFDPFDHAEADEWMRIRSIKIE
jgi:hypothetical protein